MRTLQNTDQDVINALLRARHTPVCMEHFSARDRSPKEEVLYDVAGCDVYIGVFAWRYGYIPPHNEISITESEYREAVRCHIPTLIFLLDDKVDWPENQKDKDELDIRRLRSELQETKWVAYFTSAESLVIGVLEALSYKEIHPWKPDPVPVPIPEKFVRHFQDRDDELSVLRQYISDRNIKMIMICGCGGIGKTSLVLKMMLELKSNLSSSVLTNPYKYENIVIISLGESCYRTPDRIIELISRTMDWEEASEVKDIWHQGDTSIRDRLAVLFRGPLSRHRCLIILDNMESILDCENKILQVYDPMRQFIDAILEHDHSLKIIATSRCGLILSPEIIVDAAGKSIQIDLDKGLPEEFAIMLLRDLDRSGSAGIREAKNEVLKNIVSRCSCIPRTLEVLVAALLQRPTWTLDTLLSNEPFFSRLIENPARELYESLTSDGERIVLQVLAVYGKPVSREAIQFMLPTLQVDEILDTLFHKLAVRYDHEKFWLHSLDMQYIYKQIPVHGTDYTKIRLHKLAADFYRIKSCLPKEKRLSLEDVIPELEAIDQLITADLEEDAAEMLIEKGLYENLYWWGYYALLSDICYRILKPNVSKKLKIVLHVILGKIQRNLGNLNEAQKTYESVLADLDDSIEPNCKIRLFIALGDINNYLNNEEDSLLYHQKADQLLKSSPDTLLQSENDGDTANTLLGKGKLKEAQGLYEKAIALSREAKNRIFEGIWDGDLGNLFIKLYSQSANFNHQEQAISYLNKAIGISIETADRRHESHWNSILGNFYRKLGDFEKAEYHLKKAIAIAKRIGYGRMINTQVTWLSSLYTDSIQRYIDNRDLNQAMEIMTYFQNACDETGIAELFDKRLLNSMRSHIYMERGNLNSINGRLEEAISDYTECFNLDPEKIGAALSRAEVLIWEGKYTDARISLESLNLKPKTTEEEIVYAWLLCHINNFEDKPFSDYREIIEKNIPRIVNLNYNLRDIDQYLNKLDKTKFSGKQISNAWDIQKLLEKF